LATLEPDTRSFARTLFAALEPGRCEFVREFAYRLPIDIFLTLVGADLAIRDEALAWVKLIFRGRMPNLRVAPGAVIKNVPGSTMMLKQLPLEWDS